MDELLELAERCEQANGPDREIDTDIWIAFGGRAITWIPERPFELPPTVVKRIVRGKQVEYRSPPFTASLDAAMSLVPQGLSVTIYAHPDEAHCDVFRFHPSKGTVGESEQARTTAGAICAAALRAHASQSS